MPRVITGQFTRIDLDAEELKAASTFSDLNKLYLIDLRARVAEEKINLIFDPTKSHEFLGNQAALQGKLDLLTLLIGD